MVHGSPLAYKRQAFTELLPVFVGELCNKTRLPVQCRPCLTSHEAATEAESDAMSGERVGFALRSLRRHLRCMLN